MAKKLFIIAGEDSGDQLGEAVIAELQRRSGLDVECIGVGGRRMETLGFQSIFPMDDIAVMGIMPVLKRLPLLLRRIQDTTDAIVAAKPDAVLLIDSPDFTHRVAKKVRSAAPEIPLIDYVCPSVWAWRQGRARKMAKYVDHVLALLPFEPKELEALSGPPATYVGHPLIERLDAFTPAKEERSPVTEKKVLLLLPGSRSAEVRALLPVMRQTIELLQQRGRVEIDEIIVPTVPKVVEEIREFVASLPVDVSIVTETDEKRAAFRKAHAALAASGTVCLELGLAQVPMIAIYKLDFIARRIIETFFKGWSPNLVNLILDRPLVSEFYNQQVLPPNLARGLETLLTNQTLRKYQQEGFDELRKTMLLPNGQLPAAKAVDVIEQYL